MFASCSVPSHDFVQRGEGSVSALSCRACQSVTRSGCVFPRKGPRRAHCVLLILPRSLSVQPSARGGSTIRGGHNGRAVTLLLFSLVAWVTRFVSAASLHGYAEMKCIFCCFPSGSWLGVPVMYGRLSLWRWKSAMIRGLCMQTGNCAP